MSRLRTLGVVIGVLASLFFSVALLFASIDAYQRAVEPAPANAVEPPSGPFRTRLVHQGPAPQDWHDETPPEGVREVRFSSGALELKAWLWQPPELTAPRPAVVYCHGGFAFDRSDFEACAPFVEAGWTVMCPTLRGENGNPGHFEMFMGEIDDEIAAGRWLVKQPWVDPTRVYAFGHSVGAGITSVLSLRSGTPFRATGGADGLYPATGFAAWWSEIVPFDAADPRECAERILEGRVASMVLPHHAYIGTDNEFTTFVDTARRAQAEVAADRSLLRVKLVPGDHGACLLPAMQAFIADVSR